MSGPVRRVGVILVVFVSVVALGVLFATRVSEAMRRRAESSRPVRPPLPVVQVERLAPRDIDRAVEFTGTIRPRNRVEVFSRAAGRVERVGARVGDHVTRGQMLAVVDHRDLSWQSAQARAQIAAATAGAEQARVARAAAERELTRAQSLRRSEVVAPAELEARETQMRAAEASLRAAEAQLGVARASAGLASESLRNSRVDSPIEGTVIRSSVDLGTQVMPGVGFMEIQDVASLRLQGAVPAEDFVQLRVGQTVSVRVDALADPAPGVIATLSPSLDPGTRRAAVEVTIENPNTALLPNMFATARVPLGRRSGVLAVPASVLVETPAGRAVFVVREEPPQAGSSAGSAVGAREGVAVQRYPQFGPPVGDLVPVVSGLDAGELVVFVGHAGLADQTRVQLGEAIPSPVSRAGGAAP